MGLLKKSIINFKILIFNFLLFGSRKYILTMIDLTAHKFLQLNKNF